MVSQVFNGLFGDMLSGLPWMTIPVTKGLPFQGLYAK